MASSVSPVGRRYGPTTDNNSLARDEGSFREDWNETELFPAVRMNDVIRITDLVRKEGADINAVDRFGRNALESSLHTGFLKVEAYRTLIQLGIDINHKGDRGNTALAHNVYFYKQPSLKESEEELRQRLELFRCLVERGADLDETYNFLGKTDIREKIKSHPEMEAIVQEINAQKAKGIFSGLAKTLQ